MSPELKALTAVSVAAAVTAVATPLMARVALLVGLLDRPVGYKQHARPTPYLGGVAILLGIVAAALLLMGTSSPIPVIVLGAAAMCALGTVDDWRPLPASVRLAIQTAIGIAIWAGEAGWATGLPSGIECLLTVGWVVLAANTFNLLDNLDGAASSVAAGSALGIVVIALATGGAVWAAVIAAGVLGACLAFLPFNLARPARLFLGDGGSTLLGFGIAVSGMGALHGHPSAAVLMAAALLLGVPAVDTTLVVISRRRRGAPVLTGGCDHLTHRVNSRLGDPRKVALELFTAQVALSAIAAFAVGLGPVGIVIAVVVYGLAAAGVIMVLESQGTAFGYEALPPPAGEVAPITVPPAAAEARPH